MKNFLLEAFAYNRRLWVHMLIGAVLGKLGGVFGFGMLEVTAVAAGVAVVIEVVQACIGSVSIPDSFGDVVGTIVLCLLSV